MRDLSLAQNYADALFAIAVERQNVRAVADDLETVSASVTSDPKVFLFFGDPTVPARQKLRILQDVLRGVDISPDCVGLCRIMIEKGRTELLPDVVAAFRALAADFEGQSEAWVTTAHELRPEEQQRLQAALGNLTGKSVSLHVAVDPSVIGGLVVRMENTVMDGSVGGGCESLPNRWKKEAADGDSSR